MVSDKGFRGEIRAESEENLGEILILPFVTLSVIRVAMNPWSWIRPSDQRLFIETSCT